MCQIVYSNGAADFWMDGGRLPSRKQVRGEISTLAPPPAAPGQPAELFNGGSNPISSPVSHCTPRYVCVSVGRREAGGKGVEGFWRSSTAGLTRIRLELTLLFTSSSRSTFIKSVLEVHIKERIIIWTYFRHLGSSSPIITNMEEENVRVDNSHPTVTSSAFLVEPYCDLTSRRLSISGENICSLSDGAAVPEREPKHGGRAPSWIIPCKQTGPLGFNNNLRENNIEKEYYSLKGSNNFTKKVKCQQIPKKADQ